ncbi:Hypothetical predicted protein [Lecanosticta acicola]|uniref:BTB domain-containing protein n=1 Tax=Lecanosticta acicola TaxID=111012 RepID=A0AAI9E469_9PEZI|nr:Hypothetical predicted protein [Lecanosticta acicola]
MAAPDDTVEVARNGDVILVCGGGDSVGKIIKIVASSAILSQGSSVFASMLSPHFKEGSTLSRDSQVTVPFPEDDPDSMVVLCKVLHMRYNMKIENMSPSGILQLGVVVDKYDCLVAMSALPYYWINKQSARTDGHSRAMLFVASFLFKEPETFQRLGYDLQMNTVESAEIDLKAEHHPDTTGKLLDQLQNNRKTLAKVLTDTIEKSMFRECNGYNSSVEGCQPGCRYLSLRGVSFVRRLESSKIPPVGTISLRQLGAICDELRKFGTGWISQDTTCSPRYPKRCVGAIMTTTSEVANMFRARADEVERSVIRPCLECVVAGDCEQPVVKCNKGHAIWV